MRDWDRLKNERRLGCGVEEIASVTDDEDLRMLFEAATRNGEQEQRLPSGGGGGGRMPRLDKREKNVTDNQGLEKEEDLASTQRSRSLPSSPVLDHQGPDRSTPERQGHVTGQKKTSLEWHPTQEPWLATLQRFETLPPRNLEGGRVLADAGGAVVDDHKLDRILSAVDSLSKDVEQVRAELRQVTHA